MKSNLAIGDMVYLAITPQTSYATVSKQWRPYPYFVMLARVTCIGGDDSYGFLPISKRVEAAIGTFYQPTPEQVFRTEEAARLYLCRKIMKDFGYLYLSVADKDRIPLLYFATDPCNSHLKKMRL